MTKPMTRNPAALPPHDDLMFRMLNEPGAAILGIEDWPRPKLAHQWKEGRSAMELARAWCGGDNLTCPAELQDLLDSHPLTAGVRLIEGRPEHVTPLPMRGEGRNHDLWIRGEAGDTSVTICVEAKTDESFGECIGPYLAAARAANERTGTSKRARELFGILLGREVDPEVQPFASQRYQLLTAAAGTILQARMDGSSIAVLVVHQFRSATLDPVKLQRNDADLAAFLAMLSNGPITFSSGELTGPWSMSKTGEEKPSYLLIGKIVTWLAEPT